ncbi:hypothetical protein GGR51DRAFT_562005 [Nemania sp. FL0031]|nr:hypothetical protein GGR51DRAFT_562005 [Nemania sp. FL0031]
MERLVQALLALALVASTLAAPGPTFAVLAQQPLDVGLNTNNARISLSDTQNTHSTALLSRAPADEELASFPLELRKHKHREKGKPHPSDNLCTPGDRYCHASLEEILFCNDSQQWVRYSQCQAGTFCHRLHLVCVSEIYANSLATPIGTYTPQPYTDAPNQCKEGDRRCSSMFNRVDRCTSNREWVTYHDCRRSEFCDDVILECLPRTADSK